MMCFRVWSDGRVVSLFFAPLPEFESLSIYNYNIYYPLAELNFVDIVFKKVVHIADIQ